jgi:hypothetical protein
MKIDAKGKWGPALLLNAVVSMGVTKDLTFSTMPDIGPRRALRLS